MRPALRLSAFLMLSLAAGGAVAQTRAPAADERAAPASTVEALALSPSEMEAASGGQGVSIDVLTRQQLTATTTGNTVNAGTLTSGDVDFAAGALDGFSGVGNFVINTGANNTLQGAINISIVTAPPT